ncbi:MAG: hypothetical protein QXS38_01050 [Candidatus Pacearchaeota archaeon]
MSEQSSIRTEEYFYKVTIDGKNLENPLDEEEDYLVVKRALRDLGYEVVNYICNPVFIGLKLTGRISDLHRQALKGICTIIEDESIREEMRNAEYF